MEESNPRQWFWRPLLYHLTNLPVLHALSPSAIQISQIVLSKFNGLRSTGIPYINKKSLVFKGIFVLFFYFLENNTLSQFGAVLFKFKLSLNLFLIFGRKINLSGFLILHYYDSWLWHRFSNIAD